MGSKRKAKRRPQNEKPANVKDLQPPQSEKPANVTDLQPASVECKSFTSEKSLYDQLSKAVSNPSDGGGATLLADDSRHPSGDTHNENNTRDHLSPKSVRALLGTIRRNPDIKSGTDVIPPPRLSDQQSTNVTESYHRYSEDLKKLQHAEPSGANVEHAERRLAKKAENHAHTVRMLDQRSEELRFLRAKFVDQHHELEGLKYGPERLTYASPKTLFAAIGRERAKRAVYDSSWSWAFQLEERDIRIRELEAEVKDVKARDPEAMQKKIETVATSLEKADDENIKLQLSVDDAKAELDKVKGVLHGKEKYLSQKIMECENKRLKLEKKSDELKFTQEKLKKKTQEVDDLKSGDAVAKVRTAAKELDQKKTAILKTAESKRKEAEDKLAELQESFKKERAEADRLREKIIEVETASEDAKLKWEEREREWEKERQELQNLNSNFGGSTTSNILTGHARKSKIFLPASYDGSDDNESNDANNEILIKDYERRILELEQAHRQALEGGQWVAGLSPEKLHAIKLENAKLRGKKCFMREVADCDRE
jgi:hypothetical protein